VRLACVLLTIIFIDGCAFRKPIQLIPSNTKSALQQWEGAVKGAMSESGMAAPTDDAGKRNLAIAYTEAAVMSRYVAVRTNLTYGRAATSIAFDVIDLGSTVAVPIINGARGKTILGALATGIRGTQLSIERNIFDQQSMAAILSAMDTCVLRQRSLLANRRTLPVGQYMLYDAYADLVQLYSCTTLAGALQQLTETQSAAAEEQRRSIAPITISERDQFAAVQSAFQKSVNGDKTAALSFLKALKIEGLTANSEPADFVTGYRSLAVNALTDSRFRTQFFAAARATGLLTAQ
jgi:hypothetical protein